MTVKSKTSSTSFTQDAVFTADEFIYDGHHSAPGPLDRASVSRRNSPTPERAEREYTHRDGHHYAGLGQ